MTAPVTRYKVIDTALCIGDSVFEGETVVVLASEHDALAAENERLRAELAEWSPSMQRLGDENQQLRARVAELERDAGRYRWLCGSAWYVGPDNFYCTEGGILRGCEDHNILANGLDAAIDAALQAKPDHIPDTTKMVSADT